MNKKRLTALIIVSAILLICVGSAIAVYLMKKPETQEVNNGTGTESFNDPNAFEWDVLS